MAGPSINWDQYPTADQNNPPPYLPVDPTGRNMDPSQAIPNTGINGGGGMQYNQYGPGGSADNITGPPGNYPTGGGLSGGLYGNGTFNPTGQAPSTSMGINGGATGTPTPPSSYSLPPAVATNAQGQLTNPGNPQEFFNNLFPGQTLSPEMLAAQEPVLNAQGITIIRNAAGQPSKIKLPDGSVVDPIIGAGSGQNTKAWNLVAGPGGAPMGGGVNGSAGSILGGMGYNFGSSMAPYTGQFTAPTAEQALNTPGLQFALDEANRMGQNSAAAKGDLLNGRFQQALNASNIQNALQGYGDVFNRQQQLQAANYGIFKDNQDRPFDKNYNLALLGKPT